MGKARETEARDGAGRLQSRSNGDERSRRIIDSIDPDILAALKKGKSMKKNKVKNSTPVEL